MTVEVKLHHKETDKFFDSLKVLMEISSLHRKESIDYIMNNNIRHVKISNKEVVFINKRDITDGLLQLWMKHKAEFEKASEQFNIHFKYTYKK
jgi:frataxin-like iron-binding protein CyaY